MKNFCILLTSFLFIHQAIYSRQPDSVKTVFDEIIVTATKSATPLYAIGSSISIITSKEIAERQLHTVVDILRGEPGLSIIEQGGPGKLANVFIRGSNTNHALVVVDGVTMNDASSPNNAFDFSSLNTNDVERIEIVRGPQSTLYGSDALAGIINIITKQGSGKSRYFVNSEGGSNGYYRGNISALGSLGILNYYVAASKNGSDGISASDKKFGNKEKDGYKNNSLAARIGLDLPLGLKADLVYKFFQSETSLDQSEKFGDDPNYTYDIEEHLFKAGLTSISFDQRWKQQISGSMIRRTSRSIDLTDLSHPNISSDSFNKAERIKFDWQNNIKLFEDNLITFGIETEREIAKTSYYSTSDWGPFESVFPEQSVSTTGIYLQDQLNIANSFFATIGVRNDQNGKFGGVTTFRIAPAYFVNSTGTRIKMSYGSGFKAPSLFYLFDPVFGNPDLKPEKSRGWDFGIEQNFSNGRVKFSATYFNLKVENMFGFDSNYRTVNIADASSLGLEMTAAFILNADFNLSANYTFNETRDEYSLSPDFGKPLIRRPKNQANIAAIIRLTERLNMNLQIRYVGKRDDKDFSSYQVVRQSIPDYTLANIAASYKIFSNLGLTARIENLFDRQYEEVLFYGTLGRNFYFGLNLEF